MDRVSFEKHDWTKKLVGFGAVVMTGKKGGVIAKANRPLVQGVQRHVYRLELAFKDALGKQPLYNKLDLLPSGFTCSIETVL